MKKFIPLALLCAAAIAPSSAAALEEGEARDVWVSSQNAGTITAFLLGSIGGPTGYCTYILSWENTQGTDSVECEVRERKNLGHTSCVDNALEDFETVIFAEEDCQGYDQLNRVGDIDFMFLSESSNGRLTGSVRFAGSSIVRPINIR